MAKLTSREKAAGRRTAEEMLPQVVYQQALKEKFKTIEGAGIYRLTEDWQADVLLKGKYGQKAATAAEFESALQNESAASIIVPEQAALTEKAVEAILKRNSSSKNVFWVL